MNRGQRFRTGLNGYLSRVTCIAFLVAVSDATVPAQRIDLSPADAETTLFIPHDFKRTVPFAGRYQASKQNGPAAIQLDAASFSSNDLVRRSANGKVTHLLPDLSPFPPQLVRSPFDNAATDWFIVQAHDEFGQTALRSELLSLGIAIRGYVPNLAYLVKLSRAQHATLQTSSSVFWMGLMQPAWKVAAKLDFIIAEDPDRRVQLTAFFDPEVYASAAALETALSHPSLSLKDIVSTSRGWKVRLNGMALDAHWLATRPGHLWVERFIDYQLHNNVARTSTATATGRGAAAGPLMDVEDVWQRGLRGEGQIAAVADTGLSTGNLATLHHDFGRVGLPENPARVIAAYPLGRGTWDDDQSIPGAGHGTHVVGSLLGNGVRSGADPANNHFPTQSYAGTAPKASLVMQSILDAGGGLGGIPGDLNTLFQPAYDDGARVHANSWGAAVNGSYDSDAQEVDEFVWNHQDMVITYTAGNQGEDGQHQSAFCTASGEPVDGIVDADSIGSPGTAKNAITVGASENYRPDFVFEHQQNDCTSSDGIEQRTWGWFNACEYSVPPIFSDLMADNASGLGAFSSRGPTDDGRFKPDLVAPGIAVISTRTDQNQTYQQWGSCQVPPALQPYYTVNGGTSMANPLVAGAAVLARQYFEDGWHANGNHYTNLYPVAADAFNPSAALVKATLINGAWDMAPGQYGSGASQELPPNWDTGTSLPNNAEGFGRLDLEAALFPGAGFGRDAGRDSEIHDVSPGLTTGLSDVYTINVASASDPLIVTLVWSDPYAMLAAGSDLVNDLDLIVTSPVATTYTPNQVDSTTGAVDRINNVEQVKVTSPTVGSWTVQVDGFNIPGNGETGSTTQPYALVVSGVLVPPCANPSTPAGLSATPNGSNRVDLSWNAVASDSYSVHRASSPGGPYSRIASDVIATSFSDSSVSSDVTYYYVVSAVNGSSCESAFSVEASATAFGSCQVTPSFSGLGNVTVPATGGSCVQRLDWPAASTVCAGPVVYNVYRATTADFIPGPGNLLQACIATPFFDDATAASGTEYHYIVRAEDAATGGTGPCRGGNEDVNTQTVSGTVGDDALVVIYEDDFDGTQSPADWWHFSAAAENPYSSGSCAAPPAGTGPLMYANDWYRPETGFCSGNTAASNNGAASPTYSDENNGSLVLGLPPTAGPPFSDGGIVLPTGTSSISLTFRHHYEFEQSTQNWDGGRVRISVNDWPNFVDLSPIGGYPGTVTSGTFFCPPFPGVDAYVGASGGCTEATFDLTAYEGQRIWLAWNHGGDNLPSADAGWMIDDVRLTATIANSCSAPPGKLDALTATTSDGENLLTWLNPTSGYDSTTIVWSSSDYPADVADGTLLATIAGTPGDQGSIVHSGLGNGTTYYYSGFVNNSSGRQSARRVVTARPHDTSGRLQWQFSSGATSYLRPQAVFQLPGDTFPLDSAFVIDNQRSFHASEDSAGAWPTGWQPASLTASSPYAPLMATVSLAGATTIALLTTNDGHARAFNADSGAEIWSSPVLGSQSLARPAALFSAFGGSYDLVFAGGNSTTTGTFYSLDLADGQIAWSFTNSLAQGGDGTAMGLIGGPPVVDYGTNRLYFSTRQQISGSSDTLWALNFNASSASRVWSANLGELAIGPVVAGGRVLAGNVDGDVHAVDVTTGLSLWAAPFSTADGPVKGPLSPPIGGQLVFSTTNTVWSIAVDGAAATLHWSQGSIPKPSAPAVAPDPSHVWVGGGDGVLYRLLNGVIDDTLNLSTAGLGTPELDAANQRLYVASKDGRLHAVDVQGPVAVELINFNVK